MCNRISAKFSKSRIVCFSQVATEDLKIPRKLHLRSSSGISPQCFVEMRQKETFLDLVEWISSKELQNQKGIVLCATPRDSEKLSLFLNENGMLSAFCHDLLNESVLSAWDQSEINIIVTEVDNSCLWMRGVNFTVFYCFPRSIESVALSVMQTEHWFLVMVNHTDELVMSRLVEDEKRFMKVVAVVKGSKVCRNRAIFKHCECNVKCDVCLEKRKRDAEIDGAVICDVVRRLSKISEMATCQKICGIMRGEDERFKEVIGREGRKDSDAYFSDVLEQLVCDGVLKHNVCYRKNGKLTAFRIA
jgi:superfamily II DNA helicase RecQ